MRFSPVLRSIDLLMVMFLIAVVAWTFKVKNDSQTALERVAELEKQIEAERTEIDLLKSDWALLTNPARLQKLVERYGSELGLELASPSQASDRSSLPPFRPMTVPESGQRDALRSLIDESIRTGTVKPSSDPEAVQ